MIKKFDLTSPIFIMLFLILDILICELLFFELSFYTYIVNLSGGLLFLFISYILLQKNFFFLNIRKKPTIYNIGIFLPIIFISFISSFILVYLFSDKFGFISIFLFPDLLQKNAIINSLGYFLYLNVIIFPFCIYMIFYKKHKISIYLFIMIISLFFLYFAGIKSYIFQACLTTTIMVLILSKLKKSFFVLVLFLFIIISFFSFYNLLIDLSATSLDDSLNRFLAYLTGSFATGDLYIKNNWDSPYIGLRTIEFIYKLLSFGEIKPIDYVVFYDVKGYLLNVVPLFQLTIVEGNVFFQILIVFIVSLIYIFFRLKMIKDFNIIDIILYSYVTSSFVISLIFANILGELTFYVLIILMISLQTINLKLNSRVNKCVE